MKLVSACLLGIACRYDGKSKPDERVLRLLRKGEILIPVCPEQLGGLPTPRIASEQQGEKVFSKTGYDVTENFLRGAEETLRYAEIYGIKEAILKQRSPSCGSGQIYDGTFSGIIIEGNGVTAALLKRKGIKVRSENAIR